ncbi:MAG TPA: hypothetical protein VGO68_12275, partial [Pyrinomonadaceae bacterium]|nr:hypothetical protein [Pyrinomonadaceae bacterium]
MLKTNILSIITWLPTLGAIIVLILFKKDQAALVKKFATAWFGLAFVASLYLLKYDSAIGGLQMLEDHQWIPVIGARYQMGVDGVAHQILKPRDRSHRPVVCRWNCECDCSVCDATDVATLPRRADRLNSEL